MVYIEIYSLLQYVSIIKTKVLLPLAYVTLDDLGDPLYALWFTSLLPSLFKLFGFPTFRLQVSVSDEDYFRNESCTLKFTGFCYCCNEILKIRY